MAAAPTAEMVRSPLRVAVDRRSPLVASALDPAQARARAESALPGTTVEAVQVGSVRYRPDGGATVRYRVRLAPPRGELVLLVDVPSSGSVVSVRPFPADPGLPTLPRAVDPVLMRQLLGRVVPGTGGERAIGRCTVDVVRHPRQGRCVLRYRLAQGAGGAGELRHPVLFGKVYADPAAPAAAASALRVLREGVALPDPCPRATRRRPRAAPRPRRGDSRPTAAARAARDGVRRRWAGAGRAVGRGRGGSPGGRRRPWLRTPRNRAAAPASRRGTGRDRPRPHPAGARVAGDRRAPAPRRGPCPGRGPQRAGPRGRVAGAAGPRPRRPHAGPGSARAVR